MVMNRKDSTLGSPSYHHQRFPGDCQPVFERCPKFDIRTTLSLTTQEAIREEGLPLLEPPIRVCVEIIRAQMERVPVSMLAPESSAAVDYEALAENLVPTRIRRATKPRSSKVVPLRRQ